MGAAVQATVVARDAANNILSLAGRTIVWTSSATGVATVSASGLVSAVGAGSSTIGVTVDGVGPATFVLTVSPPVPVASVSVSAPDSSLPRQHRVQATVVARDAANNILSLAGRTVVWTSSATGVATVSASGLITPVGAGSSDHRRDGGRRRAGDLHADRSAGRRGVGERQRARLEHRRLATPSRRPSSPATRRTTSFARRADGGLDEQRDRRRDRLGVGTGHRRGSGEQHDRRHRRWRRSGDVRAHGVAAVPVASVSVTAPDSSLRLANTLQATVVARDAANNILPLAGRTVVWTSSATGVATVSASGLVTRGRRRARTTIGVTVDGVGPATFVLTVTCRPRSVGERQRARLEPRRWESRSRRRSSPATRRTTSCR